MSVRRDYKSSAAGKTHRRTRRRGPLIIGLLLVTVFAGLLVYMGYRPESTPVTSRPQPTEQSQDAPLASTEAPASPADQPEPKYDFYKVLPGREVTIPEEELNRHTMRSVKEPPPPKSEAASPSRTQKQEPPPARPKSSYVIQAGSFRSHAEADQRKASLALLLGVTARIESVTGPNNGTWHRVRIGPIEDFTRAQTLRRRLQENNIQSIIVKR